METVFHLPAPSSPAFAAIMNAGGIYDGGGSWCAGTVTITGPDCPGANLCGPDL